MDGKFYKNTMSTVQTAGGPAFRNPPVFLKRQAARQQEAAALAEIESLLDQLFMHENTPVFISKRLIQRFGTSNPSAAYVEAVQRAFRTGEYGGMLFSEKYGDLAATVAAVLLHKDGDMDGHERKQFHGSLREPMLKLVHFMRSMEYQDVAHEDVVFRELQDVLGQFPFQSPTVFNFYLADTRSVQSSQDEYRKSVLCMSRLVCMCAPRISICPCQSQSPSQNPLLPA